MPAKAHPKRTAPWRKWLLLFAWLIGGCILPRHSSTPNNTTPCRSPPKAHITGWVDQLHETCAALVQTNANDKIVYIYIQRKLLPTGTKEGDYLHRGVYQARATRQAIAETRRLIQARKPLPRVFVIPGTPTPLAARKRYRPGAWRRFHRARKDKEKQRKLSRWRSPPWRRLWRHKRSTWRK